MTSGGYRISVKGPRALVEELLDDLRHATNAQLDVSYIEPPRSPLDRRPFGQLEIIQVVVDVAVAVLSPIVASEIRGAVDRWRNRNAGRQIEVTVESAARTTDPEAGDGSSAVENRS